MAAGGLTLVVAAVWKRIGVVARGLRHFVIALLLYFTNNEKTDNSAGSAHKLKSPYFFSFIN